jgi:predicted ATPase/transcriptional regulator with XRE-family HTH domain
MAESFARLLKQHRIAAGLSQETLAERAGVSVDAISYLERDVRHAPQRATLDLLITALALDKDSRHQIEAAAKLARARGPRAARHGMSPDSPDGVLRNNLPPELTSFVDRENVVAEVKELLQSYGLVTVVGTGGSGKTRCAVKIAAEIFDGFGDGVWLAELAPISDPALVTSVITRTLGIQEVPNRPMLDTLLAYLTRKRLLLILDNCEHVIDEARRVAAAILHGCPGVRILATSRESFSIAGEQSYRMPSLPVPSISELLSPHEMSNYGAVQLFNDRAVSADYRFSLTGESAPYVAEICRRLDGIPLAIELAAARVKVLSPKQLAQKLDERFRVLTTGDRTALPRHQTMRALIDWSYDILTEDERRLFRGLSIFAGSFALERAAAVYGEGAMDELAVLGLLSSLVDKSLVQAEDIGSETRYRLLESTRQYARERLRDVGEEDAVTRAHARAFVALAERFDDAYDTTPDRAWFAQVEPELENFRAALSWTLGARGDLPLGQRLAGALYQVWMIFSPAEGQRWVQLALQHVTTHRHDAITAVLNLAEASLASTLAEHKASLRAARRALTCYSELADPRGIAAAKELIGRDHVYLGEVAEGRPLLGQALEIARSLGALRLVIRALVDLASACWFAGDFPQARQHFSEALAIARTVGSDRGAAKIAINMAELEFYDGNPDAALRLADEALAVFRASGETRDVAIARCNVAAYLVVLCRYDESRAAAREALAAARDMQWSVGLAFTLQRLAAVAALRPNSGVSVIEDRRRAAHILGFVDARIVALETVREYPEQQECDKMLLVLRDALGENELSNLLAEGRNWTEDRAVAEAMLI